jgi:glycosyltransferase involved in cell wall biosynthesis
VAGLPDPAASVDVTVVTPTIHEREALLEECKASVEAQTHPTNHLIGLDWKRNGPAHTRNALLGAVSSPWVVFLDDDDLLDPPFVSTLLAASDGFDVVIPWCRFAGRSLPRKYHNPRWFDRDALRRHGCFPITTLVRTEAVLAVGGFPEARYEDWAMWNAMADNGARFTVVPTELWCYRLDGEDHRTDAA